MSKVHSRKSGLYDGFEGYRTASERDLKQVLTRGLVVLDANVLLNLYRYTSTTRADFLEVLTKIGDRLWIPHQALDEFWRNRENTIRDPSNARDTIKQLEAKLNDSLAIIRGWSKRIALTDTVAADLTNRLDNAFDEVTATIKQVADRESSELSRATHEDPVVNDLEPLIAGRRGEPFSEGKRAVLVKQAMERIENSIPPGYKDKSKVRGEDGASKAAGDYLLWVQVIEEVKVRNVDVLLVTGDVKEDWWRKEDGEIRGPRLELVQEMKRLTGRRLLMLRPESLLLHAKKLLAIEVSETSFQDINRVGEYLAKEDGEEWQSNEVEETADSPKGPGERYLLDKLPEGRSGDYLEIVADMAGLVPESPDLDAYLDAFQERFPGITLRSVARRRMRVLVSLGLVHIQGRQVRLTDLGERFIREKSISIIRQSLLDRIAGASEIVDLTQKHSPDDVRDLLRTTPPAGLSPTQARLVYRWLCKFEVVTT
ncbi:PIN-like domain-containing protein [Actinomadura sp. NPDC049753]|uniref:PIN-like domain-containing protein n=1 Tax=Actinomadura sp. NPDC049753 TaxID=3154739 RepID=UPI00343B742F